MALEQIRSMDLPEDEHVFDLNLHEGNGEWDVTGVVGPFARRVEEREPYPVLCMIHSHNVKFPSKEGALDYARKVHDILVERGKSPDAPTARLLGLIS